MPLPKASTPAIRLSALLLVAALACATAHGLQHHGKRPPKRASHEQIEQLEADWRTAALAEDDATMDKLLSDDYLGITANGDLVTKSQELDRMRTHHFVLSKLDTSDLKIKLVGQIAIVTSLAEVDGETDGRPLRGSFRYTRIYQHLPSGTWKITNFEATRIPRNRRVAPPSTTE